MTLNWSETNVGKMQEMWDKAGYMKTIGEHKEERVYRVKIIGKRCEV